MRVDAEGTDRSAIKRKGIATSRSEGCDVMQWGPPRPRASWIAGNLEHLDARGTQTSVGSGITSEGEHDTRGECHQVVGEVPLFALGGGRAASRGNNAESLNPDGMSQNIQESLTFVCLDDGREAVGVESIARAEGDGGDSVDDVGVGGHAVDVDES